ncbi:MAG: DMT family transporter [Clostridia bacterium]|nr:DMT family transporter [Clostridia bacterium]
MNKNNIKGSLILMLASLLWGLAFVVQSDAADKISPFIFNGLRSLVGAVGIFIYILIESGIKKEPVFKKDKDYKKTALSGGIICGVVLCAAVNFQQYGITVYPGSCTTVEARSGFLTTLYVVMVPIASVIIGKKVTIPVWIAAVIAMTGVYFLCLTNGIKNIYFGDILMVICAVVFTMHIMVIDKFGGAVGGARLSFIQFVVCGVLSVVLSFIVGESNNTLTAIKNALPQIIYMGVFSSGFAYMLQIIGQRYAEPAIASISMSLEGVFATLGGLVIMGSIPSVSETVGCILVFIATMTAQLPGMGRKKNG